MAKIPSPKMCVVSGRLEEIKFSTGEFCLVLRDGSRLLGKINSDILDVELLRNLWGKATTVQGIVHFKSNLQPRFIKAQRISEFHDGDSLFEELPRGELMGGQEWIKKLDAKARKFDPMTLMGKWPGDETLEELLAELD